MPILGFQLRGRRTEERNRSGSSVALSSSAANDDVAGGETADTGDGEGEREREGAPLGSAFAAELALRLLLPVAIPRPHELPLRSRSNGDSRRGGRLRGESPAMTAVAAVTGVAAATAVTRLALVA